MCISKLHIGYMFRMPAILLGLRSFIIGAVEDFNESPVIRNCEELMTWVSIYSVDMSHVNYTTEDPVDVPSKVSSVSGPLFVLQRATTIRHLT